MKIELKIGYEEIISLGNLFAAWQEFLSGKRSKRDVQQFSLNLIDNIIQLYSELANFTYEHGGYYAFNISDPKPRSIHKATVRDRVLHNAIYRQLYPFFEKTFISHSFSCRLGKGIHKSLNEFRKFSRKASKNQTRTVWVLKLDIKRFFASIDHQLLLKILADYISDQKILWLLERVINSFFTLPGKGLPLGNLTSQLFCNIYLNRLDQFIKHELKAKYYIRYADDFIILSENKPLLLSQIDKIAEFLGENLQLSLHPDKVIVKALASGVDFLGWVHFPHNRVLRKRTRNRMLKRIQEHATNETLQSYLGLLSHGNTFKLNREILNWYGLWQNNLKK